MKKVLGLLILLLAGAYYAAVYTTPGQNFLLQRGTASAVQPPEKLSDGIHVFVCGSASPLPAPDRAQACLAVLTPEHFLVVDTGSGSSNNIGLGRLPVERLDGVLLTHFHSDHISDLPNLNVIAWASGHVGPLKVYGPPGVEAVVDGFNMALEHDRKYRSEHHGEDLLPPASGVMEAVTHPVGSSMNFGELTITAFAADHSPVEPAVSYRFDYRGRSVVITGDTVVTPRLREMAAGADVLFADALATPIIEAMHDAVTDVGNARLAKILLDIQDYHAHVRDLAVLADDSDVDMIALYHLVPGPRNRVLEQVFLREGTDNMVLAEDRQWYALLAGTEEIRVSP